MASTVWDSLTCANLFVAFAAVTGFAEKKLGRLTAEYVFVVEVFWSDGRTTYVKRTYKDFLKFHKLLCIHFGTKSTSDGEKFSLPRLEGKRWFKRYTRNLAENRELELHHFVKELLKVSPDMASEAVVIEFFEQRITDPVPCPREDIRFEPPLSPNGTAPHASETTILVNETGNLGVETVLEDHGSCNDGGVSNDLRIGNETYNDNEQILSDVQFDKDIHSDVRFDNEVLDDPQRIHLFDQDSGFTEAPLHDISSETGMHEHEHEHDEHGQDCPESDDVKGVDSSQKNVFNLSDTSLTDKDEHSSTEGNNSNAAVLPITMDIVENQDMTST